MLFDLKPSEFYRFIVQLQLIFRVFALFVDLLICLFFSVVVSSWFIITLYKGKIFLSLKLGVELTVLFSKAVFVEAEKRYGERSKKENEAFKSCKKRTKTKRVKRRKAKKE